METESQAETGVVLQGEAEDRWGVATSESAQRRHGQDVAPHSGGAANQLLGRGLYGAQGDHVPPGRGW